MKTLESIHSIPINSSKICLSLSSGVLLGFSLPKIGLWWCAWFALVPLFIALRGLSGKDAFKLGLVAGIAHFFVVMSWLVFILKMYSNMNYVECLCLFTIFIFYLAFYPAFFSMIMSFLPRTPYDILVLAPSVWVVLEFLRGILFTGFPWAFIGYSQFEQLLLIQISDLFGVYGVSFLIVNFNVAIYILILFLHGKKFKKCSINIKIMFKCFFSILILLGVTISYGFLRISSIEKKLINSESIKVGVVQGNIDQSLKWDPSFQIATTKKYIKLSKLMLLETPDLVVWPETATPFYFNKSPELTEVVIETIKNIESNFIIGSPALAFNSVDGSVFYYNSAYLVSSEGKIKGRYDKSHLVPFGEYSPLKVLRPLFRKFIFSKHDFKSGISGKILQWRPEFGQLGLQICYEIIFPNLSRLITLNGAGLLVNITNDAWFGYTGGGYQHFSMSIFRAIENRRTLVRAANTGISGFIYPTGKVISKTSIFKDEVLLEEVPLLFLKTVYTKLGDFFVLFCFGAVIIIFIRFRIINNHCLFFVC